MKLCECGCGQKLDFSKGEKVKRFIKGHNMNGKNNPMYKQHPTPWNKGKRISKDEYPTYGNRNKKFPKDEYPIFGMRNKKHSDKTLKKLSEKHQEFLQSEKGKIWMQEHSERMKGIKTWNTGLTKETDERVKKMSELKRELYKNHPEKNPNWKGGISFEPYSAEFNNALKEKIKNRDDFTCQLCGDRILKYSMKKHFTIHHINYDKMDSRDENLITLCNFCNVSVNASREEWTEYFQDKMVDVVLVR